MGLNFCGILEFWSNSISVSAGTMVTSVSTQTGVIQELFKDLKITNLQAFLTEKPEKSSVTDSIHFE